MHPTVHARLLQPRVIILAAIVVSLIAVGGVFIVTTPRALGSYVSPTQGSIVEEADTTGTVKAAQSVDLSFEKSGRISYVAAAVGSHVSAGTTLAAISSADLQAAVEQAQAALQIQTAKLNALNAGARSEDIAVSEAAVTGAQNSVLQGKQSVLSAARSAYAVSDDAIRGKVDQFINNPHSPSPALAPNLTDSQLQNSIASDRAAMESLLSEWQAYVKALPSDAVGVQAQDISAKTNAYLLRVGAYLDEVASGLARVVITSTYTTAVVQGYQTNIASARANVSSALSAQNTAQTAEQASENALASAQAQLTLVKAPPTPQDLEEQQAQVASAQANLDAAKAQLGKAALSAPFTGIVTKNDAHLGEIATPGNALISMVSDAQFQIETYVSEVDYAKVKVGNTAQVTLDAYKNDAPLSAHVVSVDGAATVQNGVASYKVILQFDVSDPRVVNGLTGNVRIITQTKDNVLQIPESAIITRDTKHFVLRASSSGDEEVEVQTGITSASGTTEIISGLSAGDRIRTFGGQ